MEEKKHSKFNNAKVEYQGINFSSKLEVYLFKLLQSEGFEFKYEPERWEVFPAFVDFEGNKIRSINYTPDFIVPFEDSEFVIETKGRPNDSWALRIKLIRKHITDNRHNTKYLIPKNQQHCREILQILMHYRDTGEYLDWKPEKVKRNTIKKQNDYKTRVRSARRS